MLTQAIRAAFGRAPAPPPAEAPPVAAADMAAPVGADPAILGVLAEKVLLAWLRNRYQLLFPFVLDLRKLDARQADILVHAMVAAAQADGAFDGAERKRIEGVASLIGSSAGGRRPPLDAALREPRPLNAILAEVRDMPTAALVYAAALMAVDRHLPVNRHYLRYLASRLQLPDELVDSLAQRYRATG